MSTSPIDGQPAVGCISRSTGGHDGLGSRRPRRGGRRDPFCWPRRSSPQRPGHRGGEAFLGAEDGNEFWRGVDSEVEGTRTFLARARCGLGTRIPPHWHSEDTVAYLVEGKAVFRSGVDLADVHELGPGDWLFVPAGMVHVGETPEDSHGDFLYARAGAGGETTYWQEESGSPP